MAAAFIKCPSGIGIFESLNAVFTEVAAIAADNTECSLVRQQAAIFVSNVLSYINNATMSSKMKKVICLLVENVTQPLCFRSCHIVFHHLSLPFPLSGGGII